MPHIVAASIATVGARHGISTTEPTKCQQRASALSTLGPWACIFGLRQFSSTPIGRGQTNDIILRACSRTGPDIGRDRSALVEDLGPPAQRNSIRRSTSALPMTC